MQAVFQMKGRLLATSPKPYCAVFYLFFLYDIQFFIQYLILNVNGENIA